MIDQFSNAPAGYSDILKATNSVGFTMPSDALTCALLRTLASGRKNLLELGTGTGLSCAWLLDGMAENACLTSVDNDPAVLKIAHDNLGHDKRVQFFEDDGEAFLEKCAGKKFDFCFADTWAGKYVALQQALDLISPGGIYVVDDMLFQPNWPNGHAAKVEHLLSTLMTDHRFRTVCLAWGTGIVIAQRD